MTSSKLMRNPSRSKTSSAPVCQTAKLHLLPGFPRDKLAYCPLPVQSGDRLLKAFRSAPQFTKIDPEQVLKQKPCLRVILLAEDDYYARQAALCLTALSREARSKAAPQKDDSDDFWDETGLEEFLSDAKVADDPQALLKRSLAVVNPILLDPNLGQDDLEDKPGRGEEKKPLPLEGLDSAGVLVATSGGPVVSPAVMDQLETVADGNTVDLFLAMKPGQVDLEALEELRFTHGFQICKVGRADMDYLCRVLQDFALVQKATLSKTADLPAVIRQVQRYRGTRFSEADLESLVRRAVQSGAPQPLETEALLFHAYQGREHQGWQKLESMTGLQTVKDTLRRQLSACVLNSRRPGAAPMCRNLAFSGPPGTGKSVTARLVAQILREEGCGTGRFMEAGREQLIGAYLGHTSIKIARLFRQVQGGVLFIDEAGALLNHDGQDTYATEAVNALVRHMELHPETMVIFATYPQEMERLLASNPGLSSRVAQILHFDHYDDTELCSILEHLAGEAGYALPEGYETVCTDFFRRLRARKKDHFGNGREARRLLQSAVEELAVRTLHDSETPPTLALQDLRTATNRLLEQEKDVTVAPVGFRMESAFVSV